jgi:pimeloyl-ACP methyl ester carboxylesterase
VGGEHESEALARLPLDKRLVVGGTVVADLALRTALASAVSVAAAPWVMSGDARKERRRLAFYSELAAAHDAEAAFPPPRAGVRIESRAAPKGETLRFESPFVAQNRAVRARYAGFKPNRTAFAQHWGHSDGPRPTLCVIHGFGASDFRLNSAFFRLPWFFAQGYDVLMYVIPFHGGRGNRGLLDGAGLFANGIAHLNEALAQAVHDFRLFADYLEDTGVEQIGVTGLSLGGYVSALLAAVEPRLRVVVPNAPVTSIGPLVREWFPANLLLSATLRAHGVSPEEAEAALAVHSPLNYSPIVDKERLMIIGGLGDRLAPPEQSRMLWEHWDRPRLHWFPGNHVIHVDRGAYIGDMRRFMRDAGFEADGPLEPDSRAFDERQSA